LAAIPQREGLALMDRRERGANAIMPADQAVSPDWADEDAAERMQDEAKRAAEFLKALAHENRLMILCILSQGERSVSELERMLSLRQPTVSQQLARLRADGLVATRRDGKTIYYSLASEEARIVVGAVYEVFCGSKKRA
jgi:DNA-binding transcriptional ArsR family regulator